MSLFDFFKRKPDPPPMLPPDAPRWHHYAMAHLALRSVGLDDPLLYLAVLASPDRDDFLKSLFESVCERCDERAKPDFIASDIHVHAVRAGVYPCAVVEMPTPRTTTEAFFTALVMLIDPATSSLPEERKNVPARYFTLEKGFSLDGTPRTVLGEWTTESHLNYGDGPEPTLESFVERIAAMCSE